jgi:hypothetical protein
MGPSASRSSRLRILGEPQRSSIRGRDQLQFLVAAPNKDPLLTENPSADLVAPVGEEAAGSERAQLRPVFSIASWGESQRSTIRPVSGRDEPQSPFAGPNKDSLLTEKLSADSFAPVAGKIINERYSRPPSHRRYAYSALGAFMVLAALTGIYFRAQFGAYVRQYAPPNDIRKVATLEPQPTSDFRLANPQRQAEAQPSPQESDRERQQTLEIEQRAATAASQQALQEKQDRILALENELAKVRRDLEARTAIPARAINEVVQSKQTVKITEELRQSLRQEREKSRALEDQLARRDVDQTTLSHKTGNEPLSSQVAESSPAAERDGATQQRDPSEQSSKSPTGPTDALASGWFGRDVEDRSNDQQLESTGTAGAEHSSDAKPKRDQGADVLMKRANALLARRYFGAARGVLTRAAATGSPQAIFRLAETYDPLVLSVWKATRTRGDVRKARELYAKAYEGGVMEARDRSEALR